MATNRQKFATQVNTTLLAQVRALADSEGRQMQSLVDEALTDLIEKHKHGQPRPRVLAAYLTSHESFGELYKKLAQ